MDVGTGGGWEEGERTAGGEVLDKGHLSRFLACARGHGCGFEGVMGVERVWMVGSRLAMVVNFFLELKKNQGEPVGPTFSVWLPA